jgi:uncharacterized protein (TIRG00374 family)
MREDAAGHWNQRMATLTDIGPTTSLAVPPPWRSTFLRGAVGLGAGALLIYAFIKLVNLSGVLQRLQRLDIPLALLSGLPFLVAWAVRAVRWRMFLRPAVVSVPRAVSIYTVAVFLNWLLPLRGGELVKSLLLRRSNQIPVARSLPTVTMDKAMDLMPAVVLLALLPLLHLHLTRFILALLLLVISVLAVGVVVLALAAWRRELTLSWLSRFLRRVMPRRARPHVEPFVIGFVDTLVTLARRPRLFVMATGYTAVALGLDSLFCFMAFRAVGAGISFPVALYGYTLYNLAYILPTPPGQIGSNEVVGLLVFAGIFGVNRSTVGAMFLFSHPWTAILMAVSGCLCLSAMGISVRRGLGLVRKRRAAAEEPAA